MFIHKILTMPCDVQVWDEIIPNGISKLSFLVEVHNLYIYKALKVFCVRFGRQMFWKGCGHTWD
jgi:hypothetical protein